MEKEIPKTADELMLEALKRLRTHPDFMVWRDSVAKPLIAQLEAELASAEADNMSEVILRAKLKQVNSLRNLFITWLENI